MKPKFKYRLLNTVIKGLVALLKAVSISNRKRFAFAMASLILTCASKTRFRAMANIARAMPQLSHDEVKAMAYSSYKNIVFGVLQCFWLDELEFEFELDDCARKLLNSDTGASIATMHMGCYEAVPYAVQKLTQRSTTMSNIPTFVTCAHKVYADMQIDCIDKKQPGSFLCLLQAIRKQRVVSLHSDHYAEDLRLNFFSQETGAPCGAAMLSAYGQTPLLLSYGVPVANGRYKIYIETISEDPISTDKAAMRQAMQAIYRRFEHIILQHPEHWYWSYKRWR